MDNDSDLPLPRGKERGVHVATPPHRTKGAIGDPKHSTAQPYAPFLLLFGGLYVFVLPYATNPCGERGGA
jgi:hypothetical protein